MGHAPAIITFLDAERLKQPELKHLNGLDALLIESTDEASVRSLGDIYLAWEELGENRYVFDLGYTGAALHERVWNVEDVLYGNEYDGDLFHSFVFNKPDRAMNEKDVHYKTLHLPVHATLPAVVCMHPYGFGVRTARDESICELLSKSFPDADMHSTVVQDEVLYAARTVAAPNPHFADYIFRQHGKKLDLLSPVTEECYLQTKLFDR